ncbi:MAG: VWA domain-containing protein [Candidatus Aminicenantales bacterium]
MRKWVCLIIFLFATLNLFSQVEQYEVTVINVAVPVRVFDGGKFVSDLKIDDFELYENGVIQKIDALYLAHEAQISRSEEIKKYAPQVTRHFYLLFQLTDYDPRLAEAIDFLFTNVIKPGDTLTLMTPVKTYSLSQEALRSKPKEQISKEMQKIVRKDTKVGSSQYRAVVRDLQRLVSSMASSVSMTGMSEQEAEMAGSGTSLEFLLPRYRSTLQKMEELRFVDQKVFIQFAQSVKRLEGQKNIFFFYQKEYRPEISSSVLNRMFSQYQDNPNIIADLQDLFQFYHRYPTINPTLVKMAFADASILLNFIFLDKEKKNISGVYMREQSEDIFKAFSEVARATGGVVDTSQNPSAALKKAVEASDSYYILYYTPFSYVKDGKFRTITVRVKGKNYKVIHRLGYFAR